MLAIVPGPIPPRLLATAFTALNFAYPWQCADAMAGISIRETLKIVCFSF
jgi:hypothetical protein